MLTKAVAGAGQNQEKEIQYGSPPWVAGVPLLDPLFSGSSECMLAGCLIGRETGFEPGGVGN